MSKRLTLVIVPLALVFTLAIFGVGFVAGRYGPLLPGPGGKGSANVANFWRVKALVHDKFVHPLSDDTLIQGATKGLVGGTGDPYSTFLTKDEAKQLSDQLSGSVEGIGVEIGPKDNELTVIAPLPESPAAKAGIVARDVIVSVDKEPTAGKPVDEVAKKIRGPKGSQVTLEVRGAGQTVSRSVTLTRDTVQSPSVTLKYQNAPTTAGSDVAVITLTQFGDDTKDAFDKAVTDIQAHHPRGIVLDMRSNPGGYLEGAVSVSSVFLSDGDVVKEVFAHGKSETRHVAKDGRLASYPVVVLVDKGTASAAEITAGALRDDRAVPLVGEQTYGKGSVQELENLRDGAVLKLTIAEWLTPKGLSISKQGLKPDVAVPSDNPDAQLQAAIGQLK